ncbi:hypothetical protein QUF72_00720 [Desulfobacterales bacterium HSG2]|nr:hypothetical protein [Desulfobacterales bacterium HSG2]MDM8548559.1 hypothetical protein [Desulfobacterales bacterium HSG2]
MKDAPVRIRKIPDRNFSDPARNDRDCIILIAGHSGASIPAAEDDSRKFFFQFKKE